MKRKIIRSMMILLALALTVSYALLTAVYYFQSLRMTESELMQEAEYVTQAVGLSGISALIEMDKDGQTWTRKTLIDDDGTVLYDSWEEPDQMGNHRHSGGCNRKRSCSRLIRRKYIELDCRECQPK